MLWIEFELKPCLIMFINVTRNFLSLNIIKLPFPSMNFAQIDEIKAWLDEIIAWDMPNTSN